MWHDIAVQVCFLENLIGDGGGEIVTCTGDILTSRRPCSLAAKLCGRHHSSHPLSVARRIPDFNAFKEANFRNMWVIIGCCCCVRIFTFSTCLQVRKTTISALRRCRWSTKKQADCHVRHSSEGQPRTFTYDRYTLQTHYAGLSHSVITHRPKNKDC